MKNRAYASPGRSLPRSSRIFFALGLLTAVAFVALSGKPTLGAMSSWTQTDWSGGVDGGVGAVHPGDQAGWTKYSSLTNTSGIVSPGDVKLSTQDFTATDDGALTTTGAATGGGFGNGTTASTAVAGSGAGASVGLASITTPVEAFESTIPFVPGLVGDGAKMIRNGADDAMYVLQGGNRTGFYRYSISANTWTALAAVPGAVGGGSAMIRNGADDAIYVLQGTSTGFYRYSISADTWTALAVLPAAVFAPGGSLIRNGADDAIYAVQGGSTGFFRYSISANAWTTLAAAPATISFVGYMNRNGADDSIYVLRGGTPSSFLRYSISGNSWTTLAAAPAAIATGAGVTRNGGDDVFYVSQGNGGNGFYRYSISGNAWTTLAVVPQGVSSGGLMMRNGSDNEIYVLLGGNSTSFYRYSISGNSWTALTVAPSFIRAGAAMIRDGASDTVYILHGGATTGTTTHFHRYSISGNSWRGTATSALAAVPAAVGPGGAMIRNGADNDIYVLRGNSSTGFYKYSISTNAWTSLAAAPAAVVAGSTLIRNGADDAIYLLRGNSTGFYRYSISGNSWTTLTAVPAAVSSGGGVTMIRNGADDAIYVLRGAGATDFYRYSISGNSWTTLMAVPAAVSSGGGLIRNGADDAIYVLRGGSTTSFYRYSISGNSWTTLAAIPAAVNYGAAMIRNGADDAIYLLRGNGTGFYRYSISANAWTTLAVVPASFGDGGAMIRNGADDAIYVLQGNFNPGFYRYSISGNSWTTLAPVAGGWVFEGGRMLRNGSDQQIYILQGGSSTNLWRYTINSITYPASGTFTSAVIDTHGAASFGNLSWTSTPVANTTLTFATRSGPTPTPDGSWSAWSAELSASGGSAIVSPPARYFQYRGTFSTSNAGATPTLSDLTLRYSAYRPSGSLTSSAFDAVAETNVIDGLSWTEGAALPAGTSVTVSLRTASASGDLTGAWTDFTSATPGCTKTGDTVDCPSSAMPSELRSGSDDRFLQYKMALTTTDGGVTPTVGSVDVAYGTRSSGSGHGTITVVKTVVNDNGGTKTFSDFPLFVNGTPVASGVTNTFPAPADAYAVTETSDPEYARTFTGDCDAAGRLTLTPGEQKVCIVTNDDIGSAETVPPLIDVVKVPSPLSLPDGPGPVTYTYTLRNIGTVPVTDVTLVGDTCAPIVLVSGDTDLDRQLDVDETWTHTCSMTLSETHTNTILATGWASGISATDLASATVIVGAPIVPPLIHVTKVPSPLTLPAGGGMVTYTERITNPGTVPLVNVRLTDDKCAPVLRVSGDTNADDKLDPSETWTYTCQSRLDRTTVNTAVAIGEANGLVARDFAIVTVIVVGSPTPYSVAEALASALNASIDKSLIATSVTPPPCAAGALIKVANDRNASTQADSAVFYCGVDGKRYVFPDPGTYFSWYPDFSGVRIVSADTLSAIPFGGEVTYRPGSRMLKIESDSRVYAVAQGGVLRWVTQEAVARALYGPDWNTMISDIPAARFSASYRLGEPITMSEVTSACVTQEHFTADLSSGSSDPEVRPLQELLRCLGHFPSTVAPTGYFGPTTKASVERFQTANGISPTGTVGPMTREALNRYEVR